MREVISSLGSEVPNVPEPITHKSTTTVAHFLFAFTITLGAFLLFSVQLLVGKYVLPWFGGAVGVWTTCLLFFQTILLAGYAYVHGSARRLASRSQTKAHTALLLISLAALALTALLWPSPITPGGSWKPIGGKIAVWLVLRLLLVSVGLPGLLLATTGPLMQRWLACISPGRSPYRLYVLSNAGSLLGLLSYPVVLEPLLRLRSQAWLWSLGYLVYVIAAAGCTRIAANTISRAAEQSDPTTDVDVPAPPSNTRRLLWVFLAAMGSLMLVATTGFITQDVAPIPFLWVLPLAVYLVSFMVCFDHPRWYRPGLFHFFLLAATLLSIVIYHNSWVRLGTFIAVFLGVLFACCLFCHGELYRRRPHPAYLTSFYLMIALGGALGSVFVNLIAPLVFKGYWEMHLGIAFCAIVMAIIAIQDKSSWVHRNNPFILLALIVWTFWTVELWLSHTHGTAAGFFSDWRFNGLAILGLICAGLAFRSKSSFEGKPAIYRPVLASCCLLIATMAAAYALTRLATSQYRHANWAHRNFYGVLYIEKINAAVPDFDYYTLMHGTICHGVQLVAPSARSYPTTYYSKNSGVGLTLLNYPRRQNAAAAPWALRVGVVGLGAGTIATYGQQGDIFRFYEINPEIIRVASGKYGYFSFLSDSQAHVEIVEGDARISLERELANGQPQRYDILVIDAFNGDSIPIHLLTREAFELYLKHLHDEDSIIAVHVSNRVLDLPPVIAAEAEHFGLNAVYISSPGLMNTTLPGDLVIASKWVLLSRSRAVLSLPAIAHAASPIHMRPDLQLWTDDYSNLLQILGRPAR